MRSINETAIITAFATFLFYGDDDDVVYAFCYLFCACLRVYDIVYYDYY